MVDKSIELEKQGVDFPWSGGAEFWNEKLHNTFYDHMEASGYLEIWDREVDRQ